MCATELRPARSEAEWPLTGPAGRASLTPPSMTVTALDVKSELIRRLDQLVHSVVYKLAGLSEYDLRRPLTPTATNLLGVTFHLAAQLAEYFGETFGRPFPREDEFYYRTEASADQQDDSWVRPEATSDWVVGLYRATWEHAQETFAALDLGARGQIPTSPYAKVTLGEMMVHMVDEVARHAGHMDIVRELIDGGIGRYAGDGAIDTDYDWVSYRERVQAGARLAEDTGS